MPVVLMMPLALKARQRPSQSEFMYLNEVGLTIEMVIGLGLDGLVVGDLYDRGMK